MTPALPIAICGEVDVAAAGAAGAGATAGAGVSFLLDLPKGDATTGFTIFFGGATGVGAGAAAGDDSRGRLSSTGATAAGIFAKRIVITSGACTAV